MLISIRVNPNSRAEKIIKRNEFRFEFSVREKAENNAANKRVIEILKGMYPDKIVRIVTGHHSPSKIVEVE